MDHAIDNTPYSSYYITHSRRLLLTFQCPLETAFGNSLIVRAIVGRLRIHQKDVVSPEQGITLDTMDCKNQSQIARQNTITHKFTIYRYNTSTSEMILAKHISSTSAPTLSVGALVSSVAEEQG